MKRSRSLVLTGMVAAGGLSLQACDVPAPATQWDEPPAAETPVRTFQSAAECRATGEFTNAQCEDAQRSALADNQANAPQYADRRTCEDIYGEGQCVPRSGTGGSFVPLLTGFIIGQALSGGLGGRAYYQDRSGREFLGGGGGAITRDYVTGRPSVRSDVFGPPSTRQAPSRVQRRSGVISRGGFGGGGRGFG